MPRVLPVVLVILLVGALAFYAPLFPSLTLRFRLESNPNPNNPPTVILLSWKYQKLSITDSASIPKGEITIITFTNTTAFSSTNAMRISVGYGGTILTPTAEYLAGLGEYEIRVVYAPIAERSDTPYRVTIVVAAPGTQTYSGIVVSILPS